MKTLGIPLSSFLASYFRSQNTHCPGPAKVIASAVDINIQLLLSIIFSEKMARGHYGKEKHVGK